jgi:hypothetical protein
MIGILSVTADDNTLAVILQPILMTVFQSGRHLPLKPAGKAIPCDASRGTMSTSTYTQAKGV